MKIVFLLIFSFIIFSSCKMNGEILSYEKGEISHFSNSLNGNIILSNQTNHSNALIYIDKLDIGTSSDSLGFFSFQFDQNDTLISGIFTVYYYLADYDLDSAKFVLEKGQVVNDSLDVGSAGKLHSKQLKQLILVEGETDRDLYSIGDSIFYIAHITNISGSNLHIRITNGIELMTNVVLYNDKYPPFALTQFIGIPAERSVYLLNDVTYSESGSFIVPEGKYINDHFYPIPYDKYLVVATNFEIIRTVDSITKNPVLKKIEKYIRFKWYSDKLKVIQSPELDLFPNKYELPIIEMENN